MDDFKLYNRREKRLDSLVQTVCVFSKDIGMEFGIEKCAMLVMEKGKIVKSVGIELPDGKVRPIIVNYSFIVTRPHCKNVPQNAS